MVMLVSLLQLLNQIVCELPPEHPLSNCKPLRDSLGHTPLQVCCTLNGFFYNLLYLACFLFEYQKICGIFFVMMDICDLMFELSLLC